MILTVTIKMNKDFNSYIRYKLLLKIEEFIVIIIFGLLLMVGMLRADLLWTCK